MKNNYRILFHPEAKKELDFLDGSTRLLVLKQINKLTISPELGDALGNIAGMDLSGYRKMYVNKKKIRIVYKIIEKRIEVFIIAISNREKSKVYELASKRKSTGF
jgi:mRNA interferase RelE/StbE